MSIRSRVFDIIQPDNGTFLISRIFDWIITGLILASVIIVFVATFDLPQSVLEVCQNVMLIMSLLIWILNVDQQLEIV